MPDQTTQVRAIATQLIRQAIKQIDSETACDHVVATLGEDVDVDALAFGSESAVRKARIDISWDGAPAAPPLSPVVQSPIREQLLNALDFSFCQSLGYGTPEGLLAAYEASRTQTVDPAALRETVAGVLAAHDWLYFSRGRRYAVADAVLAVLPATTNHDTDTNGFELRGDTEIRAAVLREAAQRLYTALFPAVYADLGQKAAEGVNRAAAELRRVADETAATETARGCPPDCPCRAVCIGTPKPAAGAQQDGSAS